MEGKRIRMDEEKKLLLKKKLQSLRKRQDLQDAETTLKLLKKPGMEIMDFLTEKENLDLKKIYHNYCHIWSEGIEPKSRMSYDTQERERYQWIKRTMNIKAENEYFFLCRNNAIPIWAKIKIREPYQAVKAMWICEKGGYAAIGFLIINSKCDCVLEVGSDSRDEENYLIDIWNE